MTDNVSVVLPDDSGEILKDYGFQPKMALGGAQAIHLVSEEGFHPELAIIDLMMPEIDGLTTIRELKKILPDLNIIITSGLADKETIKQSLVENASDFLPKPSSPAEIFRVVNRVIKQSK